MLTRWQPRAVCEDQVTVVKSQLCEAARVTQMFPLSVLQRCHAGDEKQEGGSLGTVGRRAAARVPALMRVCPIGPWP